MPSKSFSLASLLCLWLMFTVTNAQTFYANVLQAAAARTPGSISVAATPAQTLPSAATSKLFLTCRKFCAVYTRL